MGKSLLPATAPLIEWTSQHLARIDQAREEYDKRTRAQPLAVAR
jgi:DNA-binding HxlR family transcriptional regulator